MTTSIITTAYVLIHRYDADEEKDPMSTSLYSVSTLACRNIWGDGVMGWERTAVAGVFPLRLALEELAEHGCTSMALASLRSGIDPELPEDLRSYIHYCVIPIEWQRDYLTDPVVNGRVRVYLADRLIHSTLLATD